MTWRATCARPYRGRHRDHLRVTQEVGDRDGEGDRDGARHQGAREGRCQSDRFTRKRRQVGPGRYAVLNTSQDAR
jgi:hypothetical protein